ncbi:unnamed protein product [Ceratitis capitata]|uniref:(Mediterranean fruit fly) hypothetical protein n=1 Tax=Ceratitis capitata TaxID=7213 RepID=A0A811VE51_CERCA|nr:unnamed protein product [Ceratitis capitata]
MGQLSSHHDKRNNENRLSTATHFSNRAHSIRKSKVHNNSHSTLEPPANIANITNDESTSLLRVGGGNPRIKGLANGRPVTISEIGKRIELNSSDIFGSKDKDTNSVGGGAGDAGGGGVVGLASVRNGHNDIGDVDDDDAAWSNSNLQISKLTTVSALSPTTATTPIPSTENVISASTTVDGGGTKLSAPNKTSTSTSEYLTIGDRYHKTNNCYYRSPNGNFHKLPSDSYHKMTDGCYVRAADGTFRRIEPPPSISNGSSNAGKLHQRGDASGSSTRIKNICYVF